MKNMIQLASESVLDSFVGESVTKNGAGRKL